MNRSITLAASIFLFAILNHNCSQAQSFDWVFPTTYYNQIASEPHNLDISSDESEIMFFWTFDDTLVIGNDTLVSRGKRDIYYASIDTLGNYIRAHSEGGYDNDDGIGLLLDGNGNIYTLANFRDSTFVGGTSVDVINSSASSYVAKFDSNWNLLFVNHEVIETPSQGHFAIDSKGNSYISSNGSYTIPNDTSYTGMHLLRYDAQGTFDWHFNAIGNGQVYVDALTIDKEQNIYAGGSFADTAIFDLDTLTADYVGPLNSRKHSYIIKIDSNRNIKWTKMLSQQLTTQGWLSSNTILDMDVMNADLFVAGNYAHGSVFEGDTLVTDYLINGFVAKYDTSGSFKWLTVIKGIPAANVHFIETDTLGNCYIAGVYWNMVQVGSTLLISDAPYGTYVIFIAKLNKNGEVIWATDINSTGGSWPLELKVRKNLKILLSGTSGDTTYFGLDDTLIGLKGFVTQVSHPTNMISGVVFHDINNNGLIDPGEDSLNNVLIEHQPSSTIYKTDSGGEFKVYVDTGSHVIDVTNPPKYYSITTPPVQVNFSGNGQIDTGNLIGLNFPPGITDVSIDLTTTNQRFRAYSGIIKKAYSLPLPSICPNTVAASGSRLSSKSM
ncbi:MAG: hypothetical protein IH946_10485, partial [Bacteroidetes bacterium]|nr:hypothetical protein [Bacteroidota bacterium]